MTKEEAIKSALKYLVHKQQEQGSWGYADNDNINKVPWDEALEWIDKQPCGDCISRQAVLEIQAKYAEHMGATKFWQMRDDIRALPSVEYETDEDCISRERVLLEINRIGFDAFTSYDYYSNLYDFIDGLPSEEPERKTGKWIWDKLTGTYHCSECGHDPLHEDVGELEEYKYCMNCGAEMEVDE